MRVNKKIWCGCGCNFFLISVRVEKKSLISVREGGKKLISVRVEKKGWCRCGWKKINLMSVRVQKTKKLISVRVRPRASIISLPRPWPLLLVLAHPTPTNCSSPWVQPPETPLQTRQSMDPLHLHYMHTTHLLTPISLFQAPALSLSRAHTLSHLLPCQSPLWWYTVSGVSQPLWRGKNTSLWHM